MIFVDMIHSSGCVWDECHFTFCWKNIFPGLTIPFKHLYSTMGQTWSNKRLYENPTSWMCSCWVFSLLTPYSPIGVSESATCWLLRRGYAKTAGYDDPIVHGKCTLGHAARMLMDTLAGGGEVRGELESIVNVFRRLKKSFGKVFLPWGFLWYAELPITEVAFTPVIQARLTK